jgi:hypothetical protein
MRLNKAINITKIISCTGEIDYGKANEANLG